MYNMHSVEFKMFPCRFRCMRTKCFISYNAKVVLNRVQVLCKHLVNQCCISNDCYYITTVWWPLYQSLVTSRVVVVGIRKISKWNLHSSTSSLQSTRTPTLSIVQLRYMLHEKKTTYKYVVHVVWLALWKLVKCMVHLLLAKSILYLSGLHYETYLPVTS